MLNKDSYIASISCTSSSIIIKSWSPQSEIMFQSNANIRFYALFCLSFLEAT